MSLPTAHNYVVKTMMENLVSLEKNFLEPKILIETLIETCLLYTSDAADDA